MVQKRFTAEGQPNGTTLSTANSASGSGDALGFATASATAGTAVYTTANAYRGSRAITFTRSTTADTYQAGFASFSSATGAAWSGYVRIVSTIAGFWTLVQSRVTAGQNGSIGLTATNRFLQVLNPGGSPVWTSSSSLAYDTDYRVEYRLIKGTTTSNGTIEVAYYLGDSLTPVETSGVLTNVNAGTANLTDFRWGALGTGATGAVIIDDPTINDATTSFIGPSLIAGTGALSGSGALTATGVAAVSGTAPLTGTGVLTASGVPAFAGSVSLAGAGASTAAGGITPAAAVNLTGTGTLTRTATITAGSSVNLTGTGVLGATGSQGNNGNANVTGTGTLTAAGTPAFATPVGLTGAGSLTATGTPRFTGATNLSGLGKITLAGITELADTAALTGLGQLTATGVKQGPARDLTVHLELGPDPWTTELGCPAWTASIARPGWRAHINPVEDPVYDTDPFIYTPYVTVTADHEIPDTAFLIGVNDGPMVTPDVVERDGMVAKLKLGLGVDGYPVAAGPAQLWVDITDSPEHFKMKAGSFRVNAG